MRWDEKCKDTMRQKTHQRLRECTRHERLQT